MLNGKHEKTLCFVKAVLLAAVVLAVPALPYYACADITQFIPRLYDYSGMLNIQTDYQGNKNTVGGAGLSTSRAYSEEELVLATNAYVFHPRFIGLFLKGGVGLDHTKYSESGVAQNPGWSTGTFTEYEIRANILPQHPYNLELYKLSSIAAIPGGLSTQSTVKTGAQGAIFKYLNRPLQFSSRYSSITTTSTNNTSDSTLYAFDGSYSFRDTNSSAGLLRNNTSNSYQDIRDIVDTYYFENNIGSSNISLLSDVKATDEQQQSSVPTSLDDRRFLWTENLNVKLPWHFTSYANYDRTTDSTKIGETGITPASKVASTTDNANFMLTHQLFESLTTSYSRGCITTISPGSESKDSSYSLSSNYIKKIPWGVLSAGVSGGNSIDNRSGQPVFVNESHTAKLKFGENTFTLNTANVETDSLVVEVVMPQGSALINLTKDEYSLNTIGTTLQLTIINLPPVVMQPDLEFVYSFQVTYSAVPANVKLETVTFGYSTRLLLFKNMVAPYYTHYASDQTVLSGFLPGGPEKHIVDSIGVIMQKRPFLLTEDYSVTTSKVSQSSKIWKSQLSYNEYLPSSFTVGASIFYEHALYSNNPLGTIGGYTENDIGTNLWLGRFFQRLNLNTSCNASYSRNQSLFNSQNYSFSGELVWTTGQISVTAGAATSFTNGESNTTKQEQASEHFYLKIKRRLF